MMPAPTRRNRRFTDTVVLVTGAAAGQGAEEARQFAQEGATVVLADIAGDLCAAVADAIGHAAHARPLDVSDEDAWRRTADWISERFGRLDVLVNNAGVPLRSPLTATSTADWDHVLNVNLRGPFLGMRAMADLLLRSDAAAVVNIGSSAGVTGSPAAAYSASKWGLRGLTRAAAMEFAPHIRVNAVHPGAVATDLVPDDHMFERVMSQATPLMRIATVDDVARVVLFAASQEAEYMTGTDISVDGGLASLGAYYSAARAGDVLA